MQTEKPNEEFPGLLSTVVLPMLAQAEQYFESALKRLNVEELVQAASLQVLASYKSDAIAR